MANTKEKSSEKLPVTTGKGGYGNPPKEHQFKKGKSGNPSGRPKGQKAAAAKTLGRVMQDSLLEGITCMVDGRRQQKLRIQAVMDVQTAKALRGDTAAAKFVVALAEKHLPTHETIADLVNGRRLFTWTPEEEQRFTKAKILEGITGPDDEPL